MNTKQETQRGLKLYSTAGAGSSGWWVRNNVLLKNLGKKVQNNSREASREYTTSKRNYIADISRQKNKPSFLVAAT